VLVAACGGRITDDNSSLAGDARVLDTQVDAADDAPVTTVVVRLDAAADVPVASHVPSACLVPGGSSSIGTGTDLGCEQGGCALCTPDNGNCASANFTNCCVYDQDGMTWSNWFYDPAPSAIAYQQKFCETTAGAWYAATP
jgi:hypothetical protein